MCLICDVFVAFSKRSNVEDNMTVHKGCINQETDNQLIKTSVFWSLSFDCTQSLRECPTLKYLK